MCWALMRVGRWRAGIPEIPAAITERYRTAGVWPQTTIGEQLHRSALKYADAPAAVSTEGKLTYRELDERTDRIGAGLKSLGLRPGDAVLLQLGNSLETVLAWYGVIKSGAIPVATLLMHRAHEIGEIGAIVEARAHVIDCSYDKFDLLSFAHQMAAQQEDRIVMTIRSGKPAGTAIGLEQLGQDFAASEARRIVEEIAAATDGDDLAVFQLSGGTTATSKVIPRTHDDYWYNAAAYARALGWDRTARVTHFLPIVHNAGMVLGVHAAHSVGAAIVVAEPRPDALLPLMAACRSSDVVAYPPLALEWRDHPDFDAATANLRRIVLTGSKVNDDAFNLFERRGIRVLGLYGATEGLIMVTRPDAPPTLRQHALGTPVSPYDTIRLLEPGTENEVRDGVPGELCYYGPTTLRGYLKSPDRNAEAFTSDGFVRSGDLVARRTIEGTTTYTFEGRIKDLINRGGEKVNAAEIEGIVAALPGIARAALVPIPDPRLGERGCLCLELVDGCPPPSLGDVTAFLESRDVAKFKWPERLEIFSALPSTQVGKLDKRRIGAEVLARPVAPNSEGAAAVNRVGA